MKLFYTIIIAAFFAGTCFSQSYNWITPNKTYLKLFVSRDAEYRINKADFIQAGVNTSNIDPRTVKVFYKGTQIPIYFEGEQDGSFDDNDFFDFYGKRNYGGLTNTYYDNGVTNTVQYVTDEYYNLYSDTSVYWVGWDGVNGLRFNISTYTTQNEYSPRYSLETVHLEKDSVYSLGETVNPNADFRYFNTEKVSGEGWYWKNLTPQNGNNLFTSFLSPNLYTPQQNCSLRIFAYPNSRDTSFNEHHINIIINGTTVAGFSRNDYDRFDTTVNFSSGVLNATSQNQVTVNYAPTFGNTGLTASVYFDLLEIKYPRTFTFVNGHAGIKLNNTDTASAVFSINGFSTNAPLNIYDINNNIKINAFSSDTGTLSFTGKINGNFEVFNQAITNKPFRIIAKSVPDLVSPTNAADYIVIYNRLFTTQAEELRNYRASHDNFRSVKTSVDDITDIFNYGIEDPVAIRRFVDYAMRNWQPNPISYVCLMGRGSLDPKHNVLTNQYYSNLVPVYGNPPSDGYFVNNNFGTFTYYKKIAIGRIPAYSVDEAQNIVDKIISYDNQLPQNWWKLFTMITGGKNRQEQIYNQSESDTIINSSIKYQPIFGESHKIYRNDSAGYITYNYADSIKHEINNGSMIVNFIGHAASQDWELGLEDPGTLVNGNKLPLVLSMTCFTGKNSEPDRRSFGERFLYNPGGGCIGFVGTTGWSFNTSGNILDVQMLKYFSLNNIRRTGDMLKLASQYLAIDSTSFTARNMVNCYDLLGDPATKLLLPVNPEFAISEADYRLSNPYPLVGETVNLTIFPKNFGTYADQCLTRFEILRNGNSIRQKDTLLTAFGHYDTAGYVFRIDTLGNYSLRVTLDADNHYPMELKSNNVITIPLPIRNISYVPLKPIYNSVIREDSVEFVGLNPQIDPAKNSIKVILQVDTSKSFNNPVYKVTQSNLSGVVTRFKYRVPVADSNLVYYWRTNAVVNNDSAGWSNTMRFVVESAVPFGKRKISKYSVNLFNDSVVTLYTRLPGQFEANEISNLQYNISSGGFELKNFAGNIQVKSYGNNGNEASYFQLPGYNLFIDGGSNAGLNIVKASRLTGKLLDFKNFKMTTSQSSDSVLNFLNTFDTSQYLLSAISSSSGGEVLNTNTKNKYRQFGSIMVDSVTSFGDFSTWAFIGYLGSSPIQGGEDFHRPGPNCPGGYCPSIANYTATFLNTSGSISFSIGPAHRWKNFSWNEILQPNSGISYDIIGYNRSGLPVTLADNLSSNSFVNLDTLNSFNFPSLKLNAKVQIDTLLGFRSPVFRSMNFKYTPPAELVADNYSFLRSDSVVQEGAQVTFSVKTYNVGFVPANAVIYKWSSQSSGGFTILKTDTVYTKLNVDSIKTHSVTFSTQGLRDPNKPSDTLNIQFEAELLGTQNDYNYYNNFAFSKLVIKGDTSRPAIEVLFDGLKAINGDPISAHPEILFKFYDYSQNNFDITDTAKIYIKSLRTDINGQQVRVPYSINGMPNPDISFNAVNNGNLKVVVTYKPSLDAGNYAFYFIGENKNNKKAGDTVNVVVSNAFSVKDLYNFPNPMKDNTNFTFMLYASESPQSCRIKIYTVAGRLIKEIVAPAKVGFNQIYWDGHDADGEAIANGIYLYKIILEDAGKTETSIQKLAVLK